MKENVRVRLSIFMWVAIAILFVATGVYAFSNMSTEAIAQHSQVHAELLPIASPESVDMDSRRLARIDALIEGYIADGEFPGAVVGVMRHGKVVYRKSFGKRHTVGGSEDMTLDTRFDLASLTKPVAVATSIMQLVERGEITLGDRVDKYIPRFKGWATNENPRDTVNIRIADLMTHTSGLPAYVSPKRLRTTYPYAQFPCRDSVIHYISTCDRVATARTTKVYSCLNYITLAYIVEKVTGMPIDEYAEQNIFKPLGMHNTCYKPTKEYSQHVAPTSIENGKFLRGVVNDPLAREGMGSVSGNAGLYSTLDDLLLYSAMLLNKGSLGDAEILSPRATNAIMTRPRGYERFNRTLGWEHFDMCSQTGGDLLSNATIGHTGATGTSIVIDPELDVVVIMLTNRPHVTSKRFPLEIRSKLATIVGSAVRE
ncbi:MAG: serine hydrolase [Alistipes sp.]|nr:serine hydrolase [Alistipes sp.]